MYPFDLDSGDFLDLLPPNIVTHFEPNQQFCDWFAEHVAGRLVVEVGAGQCLFAKCLASRAVKILAVEPRASEETRTECFNFLLPMRADQVPFIQQPGHIIVAARPDHTGWFTELIRKVHPESELLYIGLEDNIHIDIPDEIETEDLYTKAGADGEVVLRLINRN